MILTLPNPQTEGFGLPLRAAGGILGDLTRIFATLESTIDVLVSTYHPGSMGLLPGTQLGTTSESSRPPELRVSPHHSPLVE